MLFHVKTIAFVEKNDRIGNRGHHACVPRGAGFATSLNLPCQTSGSQTRTGPWTALLQPDQRETPLIGLRAMRR